ncbi:uncharacterized protein ACIBXB_017377 [Morphnus guianensis]
MTQPGLTQRHSPPRSYRCAALRGGCRRRGSGTAAVAAEGMAADGRTLTASRRRRLGAASPAPSGLRQPQRLERGPGSRNGTAEGRRDGKQTPHHCGLLTPPRRLGLRRHRLRPCRAGSPPRAGRPLNGGGKDGPPPRGAAPCWPSLAVEHERPLLAETNSCMRHSAPPPPPAGPNGRARERLAPPLQPGPTAACEGPAPPQRPPRLPKRPRPLASARHPGPTGCCRRAGVQPRPRWCHSCEGAPGCRGSWGVSKLLVPQRAKESRSEGTRQPGQLL